MMVFLKFKGVNFKLNLFLKTASLKIKSITAKVALWNKFGLVD